MPSRQHFVDYLAAASIVVAFGGLFIGRMMIYPVATAHGTFLERVAARNEAWDLGHRVMLAGMICLIPAAIALRRALRERAPWLCDVAAALTIFGAALGVGQFALDFAMLAAAQIEPPEAGAQFLRALESHTFVQWAFYKLPDFGQLGLVLVAIALWRQTADWRLQAVLVSLAAAVFFIGPPLFGSLGARVALGMALVGFSSVAWKIVRQAPPGA